MSIQRLYVQNFRSFRQIDLALPNLSVLVGANVAGKSNFVQIFRFLRDVAREGFENAIALQGGVEYLRNFTLGASMPLEIRVSVATESEIPLPERELFGLEHTRENQELEYQVVIDFSKRGGRYRVVQERVVHRFIVDSEIAPDEHAQREVLIERLPGSKIRVQGLPFRRARRNRVVSGSSFKEELPSKDTSILHRIMRVGSWFRSISLFDFDIKSLKNPAPLESRPQLAEDGSNLAAIIRRLAANQEQRRRLQLHLHRFLPFIADVKTQATMEKAIAYQIRETYSSRLLPSQLLSDGTAELLALIVALYFTPSSVTLIEEPDRNLHPALIERLVNACQEVSREKPVIITTHNPEVVRYTPFESLLLIERDAEGFSIVRKPSDSAMVQEFLKHELMPSDLFVDNMLGV